MEKNNGLLDQLWPAKLMYLIFNFSQAAAINFLPIFFQTTIHFTKWQIGILQALPCICNMLAPPFWGVLADKIGKQRLVHNFVLLSGAALMFSLKYINNFKFMCFMIILTFFQTSPIGSLLDQTIMYLLHCVGGEYGKQRLFGAIGYGLGAYLTGMAVASLGISWAFNIHIIFAIIAFFVLSALPAPRSYHRNDNNNIINHNNNENKENEKLTNHSNDVEEEVEIHITEGLRLLAEKDDVKLLFFVVFVLGLKFGVISSFLTLNLYNLSNSDPRIIGIAIACETFSELPAFFFSHQIIEKLGIIRVLFISILGYALRLGYYYFMVNPWTAIPFEFLHGVTFGLAWAACTQYVYAAAPKGTHGVMMGLLSSVQNGLGKGFGTLVGGYFYGTYGATFMWFITAVVCVPIALIALFFFAINKNKEEEIFWIDETDVEENEARVVTPLMAKTMDYGTVF